MKKNIDSNSLLPLDGIEVMQDELLYVGGGTSDSESVGVGCNCGCPEGSEEGAGLGCNCSCNEPTLAE